MLPYQRITEIPIGFVKIKVWGLLVAIAFIVSILLAAKEAKRKKFDMQQFWNFIFFLVLGALIGSRIGFVIEYWYELSGFLDVFKVWQGGMSIWGGILGAIFFTACYAKYKKIPWIKYADLVAPFIGLGIAIGRIGCFLIGDHIGTETNLPWAINYGGYGYATMPRHPVALYHSLAGLILFFAIKNVKKNRFLFFIIGYSALRFVIDFFRIDPSYAGLHSAQWICIAIFILSSSLLLKRIRKWKRKNITTST